jgi:hypothetical protein
MDISELLRLDPNKPINRHPWERVRARIIAYLLRRHAPHSKHIADIGSGDAYVLSSLANKKMADDYSAVDTAYTNEIIKRIQTIANNSIHFYPDTSHLPAADSLLLTDVLEHCEDDLSVLRSLTRDDISSGDAIFFITVPAFQRLFSEHDRLLHHYRRYSRRQINNVAKTAGLEVLESGYFFHILVPVRLIQLFLEKIRLRKPRTSLDNWRGNKLITTVFSAILWANFRIGHLFTRIGLRIPGLSCYCICRKLPS